MDCAIANCYRVVFASGICRTHHRHWKMGKIEYDPQVKAAPTSCKVDGCLKKQDTYVLGFCTTHYHRNNRYGDPLLTYKQVGGTRSDKRSGYVWINGSDPRIGGGRGMWEHRYVMEKILGRKLLPKENVHHINGIKNDNRESNLELWTTSQPAGQRVADKIAWAKELLALYEPNE